MDSDCNMASRDGTSPPNDMPCLEVDANSLSANDVLYLHLNKSNQTVDDSNELCNGTCSTLPPQEFCPCSISESSQNRSGIENINDKDTKGTLEIHSAGLREDAHQENQTTTCRKEGSGLLQQSLLSAADMAEESKLEINQTSEKLSLYSDRLVTTVTCSTDDGNQRSEISDPNSQSRNVESTFKDKYLMEHSACNYGKSLCFSDGNKFEEVIFSNGCHSKEVDGSSQELHERLCAHLEASDTCSFEQSLTTCSSVSKDEIHVHLKERTGAWENLSDKPDIQRCSEPCQALKSSWPGETDCSNSDGARTVRIAEDKVTDIPATCTCTCTCTSPNVESTAVTCICCCYGMKNQSAHLSVDSSCSSSDNFDDELTTCTCMSKLDKSIVCEAESLTQECTSFKFFDELPHELFFKILGYFSICELCLTISPVCRDWWEYSKSPVLWQYLDFAENRDIGHNQLCSVLARVSLLKSLSLRGRDQLCVSEVRMLQGCPLLTSLNLGFCDNVNGRILDEIIRCCPVLEVINMEGCEHIDDDVAALFPLLPCLKALNLSHCTKITDDGIVLISLGCLLLDELNVDGIPWTTDRAVNVLASKRSQILRAVYLDGAELSDLSVSYLMSCPLLHTFSLSFCEQLTDKALSMLQTLNHLRHLRLTRGLEFSEEALCRFFESGSVGHLTFLDLSECSELMDKGVTIIAHRCPELRKLAMCWCWSVSDVGIEEIVLHCSQLRYLDIVGLDKVKGQCLATIPEALPRLTLLDLRQCNLIDDKMLVDLVKVKPNLYIFNYYGEQVTPDMIL